MSLLMMKFLMLLGFSIWAGGLLTQDWIGRKAAMACVLIGTVVFGAGLWSY